MATNPLYNTNDSPNKATQPSKSVNDMQVFVNRNRNTFDLSYFNYKTQRFGQYEPFFVMEGVPGDTIPLHSSHQVRSLPMKSPFLSSLTLSKDYFMVPMQSILPNTWEMIFTNPASGDDVPADCMPIIKDNFIPTSPGSAIPDYSKCTSEQVKNCIFHMLIYEYFFSSSSLFAQLGLSNLPSGTEVRAQGPNRASQDFDSLFDAAFLGFYNANKLAIISSSVFGDVLFALKTLTPSQFMDYIRIGAVGISFIGQNTFDCSSFKEFFDIFDASPIRATRQFSIGINISRILAYQLCCQQFYVNTKIDPIYNAQIYRDNFFYVLKNALTEFGYDLFLESFIRNGVNVPYDFFSSHYFDKFVNAYNPQIITSSTFAVYEYLFAFRHVLKFGDYFTSSRTQPLGTDVNGQMNAPVVGEKVAAIDMSKSIVMQRFLNNVVKLGNDFGEYLRGIFGTEPSPDYHFPKFISHQEFNVSGFEVANSNDSEQGKLVTNLNTNDDKFAFEIRVDMPCIILGISNFNCPRVYSASISRFAFHNDRFDMFNPMLQYIGDQPVNKIEMFKHWVGSDIFGYQSRHSEYKQNYSIASGSFYDLLPSWSFIVDNLDNNDFTGGESQGSYALRCKPSEFDRFYSALSGLSLGHAFHFIVVYNNKVMASRPMAVNPSIL